MKKRKKNQKSTLLRVLETICGFLFAIALMLLIWDIYLKKGDTLKSFEVNLPHPTQNEEVSKTPDMHVDQNAVEEKKVKMENSGRNVAIPGYKTMSFKAGTNTVFVDLFNPDKNSGYYYLTFELKIPDSKGNYETLYKSDLVEGGKHLYQITLNHALLAGVYEHCILHVQPYTINDLTPTNNADVEFTLKVQ